MTDKTIDLDAEMAALDAVDPLTHRSRDATHFRAVIAAQRAVDDADQALRETVAEAHAAGDSWTVIGAALGISRQAAFKRFAAG